MACVFMKRKEMLIHFGTKTDRNSVPSITANGNIIERVNNFKLLGVALVSLVLTNLGM